MLHYPVLSCEPRFYPSNLLSLDDPILGQPFLKFVLACFTRNGGNPARSPIMSPMNASKKLLNLLPTVKMFACEVDPLRD